jgi:hypothetical protein
MNDSMVHQAARAVKRIVDPIDVPTVDEENDRRYTDDDFRMFRVPVTLTRQGFVRIFSRDAQAAESVAKVMAAFADDIEKSVQTEQVGTAIAA